MFLVAPSQQIGKSSTSRQILLPSSPNEFTHGLNYTTPYHECKLKLVTAATETFPSLFKPKEVEFNRLRLLGPLSTSPKWYHKQFPHLITSESWKGMIKNGKTPSNVPIKIEGKRDGYTLRRSGGTFVDLEGLERALLENAKA